MKHSGGISANVAYAGHESLLRGSSLDAVMSGDLKKAKRLEQGSNVGWRITVRPDSSADVTILLPETTDCDTPGAICAGDGRMLSSRLDVTVRGPGG